MTSSRDSKKIKKSYSLRKPKSPALLDTSTGFYDRLEEIDYPKECLGWDPLPSSGDRDAVSTSFNFYGELGDLNGKSPLITEGPKGYRKKQRRSRSLRVPKTSSPPFSLIESDGTLSPREALKAETKLGQQIAAHPTPFSSSDEDQLLIEGALLESVQNETERQNNKKRKQYRKTIDRAFRRGWENFVASLYTVSLARSSPSPSAPPLVKAF
ncbi:uncharacterized protein LOC115096979 [Rhinatrema bivittatum]|uniref:uncharacterized protein LOC115096979 n=1 Tax=Rhinatrema bivittatum TaxID=194408 RepID=UPI001127F6CD|nr:uncharacterized protein LOC115096979 [Rhinatrema bivittatum]